MHAHLQVVVAPPELHWQSLASPAHEPWLCGDVQGRAGQSEDMEVSERRVIAHRALLEIRASNAVINLGVGMPEVLTASHWASTSSTGSVHQAAFCCSKLSHCIALNLILFCSTLISLWLNVELCWTLQSGLQL